MSEIVGNSIEHLKFFINKIENNEPFCFLRIADGEFMIIIGTIFNTQDGWSFNGGCLQHDLIDAVEKFLLRPGSYVGLPCYACWDGMYVAIIDRFDIQPRQLTYANLFCNKNWKPFTDYLKTSKKSFYYVGSGTHQTDELNIIERYHTDEKLIHNWNNNTKDEYIELLDKWVNEKIQDKRDSAQLFLLSVGPIAKIYVSYLYRKYPTHQFIDCGSSIDLFTKGTSNRPYLNPGSIYYDMVCDFKFGHKYKN